MSITRDLLTKDSYTAGHFELIIDGTPTTAYLKTVDGGWAKHSLVDEPIGPNNLRVKHASVVEIKQSATAPRSRILRMVLANYHDQRIFTTLIPTRLAHFQPGDLVWVIIPSTTPRWAIS